MMASFIVNICLFKTSLYSYAAITYKRYDIEVLKFSIIKMHRNADVEDTALMQRQRIIESLQLMLIVQPQLDDKVTLLSCFELWADIRLR